MQTHAPELVVGQRYWRYDEQRYYVVRMMDPPGVKGYRSVVMTDEATGKIVCRSLNWCTEYVSFNGEPPHPMMMVPADADAPRPPRQRRYQRRVRG